MAKEYSFKPVYGYGWHRGDEAIEVPETFVVMGDEAGNSVISGEIVGPHPFSGRSVSLSLRSSTEGVKHFNVVIQSPGQSEEVTGFAELEP